MFCLTWERNSVDPRGFRSSLATRRGGKTDALTVSEVRAVERRAQEVRGRHLGAKLPRLGGPGAAWERRAGGRGGGRGARARREVGNRERPWRAGAEKEGKLRVGAKVPLTRFPVRFSTLLFSKFHFCEASESWGKAALNENIPRVPC